MFSDAAGLLAAAKCGKAEQSNSTSDQRVGSGTCNSLENSTVIPSETCKLKSIVGVRGGTAALEKSN